MKKICHTILLLCLAMHAYAQTSLDSVLSTVARNNKGILANAQYWQAQTLTLKTALSNPKVDYDYMNGSPAVAGNQTDFAITQSFDFPTVYGKKKQLFNAQLAQADIQMAVAKQAVLLEAKLLCLELIYRNKLHTALDKRRQDTEKWLSYFVERLEKGDGNMLDVNKAKLQLIEINAAFQENQSLAKQLQEKLAELNGGQPIAFTSTAYPALPELLALDTLMPIVEENDPTLKYWAQAKAIEQTQVAVTKALSLPKLETGYHYQAILGQTFQGVHVGFTVPLWEHKNKTKAQQAHAIFADMNLQANQTKHLHAIRQLFEKQRNLQTTLNEYATLFETTNSTELLNQSLALGQISTLEYFMEMSYYYNALNNYLSVEKEYHQTIAELYKHLL